MDIPQSKWARGSKLLKMASKIAAQELSHRLPGKVVDEAKKLALRIDQTRELVATLSQMKGAAMKAGQLLGLEAGELLPPEVVEVLSKLQAQGEAYEFHKIEAILKEELGEKFLSLSQISTTPIASASIGQVHKAIYQNKSIVLKVQFPGIADTIDSDIDMLECLLNKFKLITNKKVELRALFDEIKATLKQETDYLAELQYLESYKENFKDKKGFLIPSPIKEMTTKKVLAMEYVEGLSLNSWSQVATLEQKQLIGEKMLELFLYEYLECGLVQTDPNWGNFMVNSHNDLIILDFGACKSYSKEFIITYRKILDLSMRRQKAALLEVSQEFGLIDPREDQSVKDKYLHMMDVVIAPFRHQGVFDFATETYSQASKEASIDFAKSLKFSPPPKNLIFLHRKLGGVFLTMKRLETKMDLRLVWERMV